MKASRWTVLLVPGVLLVFLQETDSDFPHPGFVLLSAIAQHVVAGIIVAALAIIFRWGPTAIPVWVSFATWGAIAVSRGVVGGILSAVIVGDEPDYASRVFVWLLISWTSMPLFVYTVAQLDHRRRLLSSLTNTLEMREEARYRAERSAEEIRQQLVLAINEAVITVREIRSSLSSFGATIGAAQLRLIGDRLAAVSVAAGQAVEQRSEIWADGPNRSSAATPLSAALDFERKRSLSWTAYTAALLFATVVPLTALSRNADWTFLVQLFGALVVCLVLLALGPRTIPRNRLSTGWLQLASVVSRYGGAGLAGSVVLSAFRWQSMDAFTTALILLFPLTVALSAAGVSATVGVASANAEVIHTAEIITSERLALQRAATETENRIRAQLDELMHGPVQGRLSACAMALNFHAAEIGTAPAERTEFITAAVLEHLDAALEDLQAFGRSA